MSGYLYPCTTVALIGVSPAAAIKWPLGTSVQPLMATV